MQTVSTLLPTNTLAESRTLLNDNFTSARSCHSGGSFPSSSLLIGMLCYRTDLKEMYVLRATSPAADWRLIARAEDTLLTQEDAEELFVAMDNPVVSATWLTMLSALSNTAQGIKFEVASKRRWDILKDSSPEVGANVGSDIRIRAWSDTGTFIGDVMVFRRASRIVEFAVTPLVAGNVVWHSGNDGTGSDLDAGKLEGNTLSDLDERYAISYATTAQIRAMSGTAPISPTGLRNSLAHVALTDGASIALDFSTGINFILNTFSVSGTRTFANPTNAVPGSSGVITIVQDGVGGRAVAWGANYKFPNGVPVAVETDAGATTIVQYYVVSSTFIVLNVLPKVA